MNGSIFLLGDGDQLTEMREEGYASEDLLQSLLERHPSLLAGDQMSGGEDKRWLLVKREASVPAEEGAPVDGHLIICSSIRTVFRP